MNTFRRSMLLAAGIAGVALVACEHAKSPAPGDSANVGSTGGSSHTLSATPSTWDRNAGPVLLVTTDTASRAFLILPDTATAATTLANIPREASVTLFGRGGTVQTAELQTIDDTEACPIAMLRAAPPPRAWSVGFIGGVIAPLAMDSTAGLPHADSAAFVVWMNRLASALPNDSAGRFAGLPFMVSAMWRFTIPDGPLVVIATLQRQLNQEATPLEEHTLLVTERAPNDTTVTTAYSERIYGDEETIETSDMLASALIGSAKTPAIVLARDYGDATSYALLERVSAGRWQLRWVSSRRHC